MPIELQDGEEILATDQVLHYSSAFLAHNADCWLTTTRIYLEPKSALDRLSGRKAEAAISAIQEVSINNGNVIIRHSTGEIHISGSGGERLGERLQLILEDPNNLQEKVLFQGDTNVYVKGPLSTRGEIILSNKNLLIRSTGGLENYIFESKELSTPLLDITHIDFSNLEQKLTIESTNGIITIGGKNAARLHSTLRSLEGSDVEELENVAVEHFTTFDAMLYRGASKSSITGTISFSPNRMTFAPLNVLDTLTGAQLQIITFEDIQKISKRNRLEITTLSTKLIFITNHVDTIYNILVEELGKIERPNLFTDIRSKLYSETLAFSEVKELSLPFNAYSEVPILCDQCMIFKSDNSCYFAYAFVTEENTRLLTPNKQILWAASNSDIAIVENRLANDPTLQLKVKEQRIHIRPKSGLTFREFYIRKLKENRPSEAEQFSKENQPVQRILGLTNQVELSYNGEILHTIYNTRVSAENRGIQISSERVAGFSCQLGDKLQIEIPKKEGRYRFQSVISEQYLVTPDPIGRYYLTLSIPSNIALFNDRGAYRAPFEQILDMQLLEIPPYDLERENPLDFIPKATEIYNSQIQLRDLSVSGCGFLMRRSIFDFQIPLECLVFKGTINIDGEDISWMALPKYEVPFRHQQMEFKRIGAQFIGMNNLDRSLINRSVLKIEREQLRKEQEQRTEDQ